ncbi:MAG: TetR/AcrR family transcriptional regulator [Bacteroidetes bacterium]|nr:TetR/AcrR family transcriptional regulator [Bacteroidota bacterium]
MAESTEQLILNTARKHFVKNGFVATRMQEIADEAGINKAMLHYYYRSKQKLYQEVLDQALSEVVPRFAAAISTEGPFWTRVENFVDIYLETLLEHPEIPIFMMTELSQKREQFIEALKKRANLMPALQSFIAQMMAEMEAGNIREVPPMHLFLNIMGMTVFPFLAKPVFVNVFETGEPAFHELMKERKTVILDFLKRALAV